MPSSFNFLSRSSKSSGAPSSSTRCSDTAPQRCCSVAVRVHRLNTATKTHFRKQSKHRHHQNDDAQHDKEDVAAT